MDARIHQIGYAALADRLTRLSRRGLVMRDEFPDIWAALDVLSYEMDHGIDLLELSKSSKVLSNGVRQRESR